jgi:peptidoglycan/xylan/chitin deacetylase (PgdA/CDA1 family)
MRLALTFDDGPGPATEELLDVLDRHAARATFFILGSNLERARPTVVRAVRAGHLIGNHTFSHARPGEISGPQLAQEIVRTDEMLRDVYREASASPRACLPVRLPYGLAPRDPRVAVLASLGRTHTHWTGDFEDWVEPAPEPAELSQRMRAHVVQQHEDGLAAVLCLHDSSRQYADRRSTVRAVDLLLSSRDLELELELFTTPHG